MEKPRLDGVLASAGEVLWSRRTADEDRGEDYESPSPSPRDTVHALLCVQYLPYGLDHQLGLIELDVVSALLRDYHLSLRG